MIDPLYRIGRTGAATDAGGGEAKAAGGQAQQGSQQARGSRFGALMYAMLKPPSLDLSEASGDDDDAPRPPMKAYVKPNLAKLMREVDPSARPFASAQAAASATVPAATVQAASAARPESGKG